MNGIEKITARIQADAQADVDRILADAREQAEKILSQYRSQAAAETASLTARNQRDAAEREERLVAVAQMEARKVGLSAKQEMLEQAYALALKKLRSLSQEQAVDMLAELLVQAAPDGRGAVILSQEDRARIGQAAVDKANARLPGGALTLAEETRPLGGGFILSKGSVEVNGTFDTLIRLQKTETAGAVAKLLFPEA